MALIPPNVWTVAVSAVVTISGRNSLNCSYSGQWSFELVVGQPQQPGPSPNSFAGPMKGTFNANGSQGTAQFAASGTIDYFAGGTYDGGTQTISITGISTTGLQASGSTTQTGDGQQTTTPFSVDAPGYLGNWSALANLIKSGSPPPTENAISNALGGTTAAEWMSTTMNPNSYTGDSVYLPACIPHMAALNPQPMTISLNDADSQSVTQTFQDEMELGSRTTVWTFKLTPPFTIKRDDRTDATQSFISTDTLQFHIEITGAQASSWSSQVSWNVTGKSTDSGDGNPNQQTGGDTFSFTPNPTNRPTGCSRVPNEPIMYDLSATLQESSQTYNLVQDETDIMRQEYLDLQAQSVPTRDQFVPPASASFDNGSYSLIMDDGLQTHLDAITQAFDALSQSTWIVSCGYRNPRNNACVSHVGTTSHHVWGRALDLQPTPNAPGTPAFIATLNALRQAGTDAGNPLSICEAQGAVHSVPCETPGVNHVHVQW